MGKDMNHEAIRKDLDDFLDGRLGDSRRRKVENHLEECAACREEAHALRTLMAQARSLPREIDPARDLWPGIETEIRAPRRAVPERGSRPRQGWSWNQEFLRGGVAAAVLVIVLWAGTLLVPPGMRGHGNGISGSEGPRGKSSPWHPGAQVPELTVISNDLRPRSATWARMIWALEEQDLGTRKVLSAALAGGRDPEAIARSGSIEPGLHALDIAIDETAAALRRDPENAELTRTLIRYYERKLELFRLAVRIAGGTLT
jgi:hypothetical protein